MTLIVARKLDHSPAGITAAFRGIEAWANALNWAAPVLAAGWSNTGGDLQVARFMLDPFGFVVVEGFVTFAGNIASGTSQLIFTLPPSMAPPKRVAFPPGGNPNMRIDVYGNATPATAGQVQYLQFTGANQVNPPCNLSGVRFAGFN